MYAVVNIAGFDYKVKPGDRIRVPNISEDTGAELEFSNVKLLKDEEKVHFSPKAKIRARVLEHKRGKKVIVFKFKKRKEYRRKIGFKPSISELEVTSIESL
ncbi:50S ribosomal protein L21 [bacterium]|nr:50S ribosomal protein L21 [bacterium]